MSYVKKVLVPGEQIRYRGHYHLMFRLLYFWLPWRWTTEWAVTSRRLIFKRGWISRKTEELGLHRIEEVQLRQGLLGRIFSYGKVYVQGTGGGDIILPSMGSPMRFKRELDQAKARAEVRA